MLWVMHSEQAEQATEGHRMLILSAWAKAEQTTKQIDVERSVARQLQIARLHGVADLSVRRAAIGAAETGWAAEKAQLLASRATAADARQKTANAFAELEVERASDYAAARVAVQQAWTAEAAAAAEAAGDGADALTERRAAAAEEVRYRSIASHSIASLATWTSHYAALRYAALC